jgi:hypothetical protein
MITRGSCDVPDKAGEAPAPAAAKNTSIGQRSSTGTSHAWSLLKPPASVCGSSGEQSSHERPKNTTEEGIDRCFQYFQATPEKPKRKPGLLI